MKNVSNDFRNELLKKNRHYIKSCDVAFTDGTVLSVDDSFFWPDGFKAEEAVSGPDTFDIGSAIIGKFTLILNNIYDDFSEYDFTDAKISNIKVGLRLSDKIVETVLKGIFTVDEPTYNGSLITLECLDNMAKFDKSYATSKLVYPATLGAIVRDACNCCDVSLAADSASFENDDIVIPVRPSSENLTFRNVLLWVGQISCHWCKCNEYGQLTLGWYDMESYEKMCSMIDGGTFSPWTEGNSLDGGTFNPWTEGDSADGGDFSIMEKYHHIFSLSSLTIATDDVVITGVRVTEKASVDSTNEDVIYQSGTEGYVLSIEGNELIQGGLGQKVAELLGNKLIGLRFRPLSTSCLSDPSIEAGDLAFVTDRKGRSYATLITSTVFQAGNYQTVSCGAETPRRKSAERYSEATRIYQELRKRLQKNKTEWEKAIEDLDDRLTNSSGAYTTVETLESGGSIFYLHDRPTLEESKAVWKMTAEAWGVSTDGGKTWNGGMTVDGDTITKILTAVGVNAEWITAGALTVKDSSGNVLFSVDMDTKSVYINGDSVVIGGKSATQAINEAVEKSEEALTAANNARALSIVMTNEYQGVPTDADGNYTSFPSVTTTIMTYFGHSDVLGFMRIHIHRIRRNYRFLGCRYKDLYGDRSYSRYSLCGHYSNVSWRNI